MTDKTATICLTVIAVIAIVAGAILGLYGYKDMVETFGYIVASCVAGVVGYTVARTKAQPPVQGSDSSTVNVSNTTMSETPTDVI